MLKSYENMKNAFLDQIKWSTKFTDNKIKLREGTQIWPIPDINFSHASLQPLD